MVPNNNRDTNNKGVLSTSYIIINDTMEYIVEYDTGALCEKQYNEYQSKLSCKYATFITSNDSANRKLFFKVNFQQFSTPIYININIYVVSLGEI